jgi:hypothetical protein
MGSEPLPLKQGKSSWSRGACPNFLTATELISEARGPRLHLLLLPYQETRVHQKMDAAESTQKSEIAQDEPLPFPAALLASAPFFSRANR